MLNEPLRIAALWYNYMGILSYTFRIIDESRKDHRVGNASTFAGTFAGAVFCSANSTRI